MQHIDYKRQKVNTCMADHHVQAIIVSATAVFVRDLMQHIHVLHHLSPDKDVRELINMCTRYLLQSPRAQQLERIVTAVIQHEYHMPDDIENEPILQELMEFYTDALQAEKTGQQQQYRNEVLFPTLVDVEDFPIPTGDHADELLNSIEGAHELSHPTQFQKLVLEAVRKLYLK